MNEQRSDVSQRSTNVQHRSKSLRHRSSVRWIFNAIIQEEGVLTHQTHIPLLVNSCSVNENYMQVIRQHLCVHGFSFALSIPCFSMVNGFKKFFSPSVKNHKLIFADASGDVWRINLKPIITIITNYIVPVGRKRVGEIKIGAWRIHING